MQGTPGFLREVAIPWSQVEEAAHHPSPSSFLSITQKEHAEEAEAEAEGGG